MYCHKGFNRFGMLCTGACGYHPFPFLRANMIHTTFGVMIHHLMFDLLQILFAFHHCFKVCFQFYPSGGKCVPKLGICFCVDLGSFELSFATKTSTICLADRIFLLKTSQVSATPRSFSNCSFISLHIRPIVSATSQSWLSKTKPKGIFTRHN